MAIPSKTDKVPEMVERVARALATAAGAAFAAPSASVAVREFGWDADGVYMRQYVDRHWREHVHAARLAIAAMRDPPREVYAIFNGPDFVKHIDRDPEYYWPLMIDEMLK
jgi:hypothetical protein